MRVCSDAKQRQTNERRTILCLFFPPFLRSQSTTEHIWSTVCFLSSIIEEEKLLVR